MGPGDLLFLRVGHRARRRSLGPWDAAGARAGLHPSALELLAGRRIAALGSDGNNDTAPSAAQGVDFPVHVLAVNAMGLYLLDYLDLDALTESCAAIRRWSFLCVVAPLRLTKGTGSPGQPDRDLLIRRRAAAANRRRSTTLRGGCRLLTAHVRMAPERATGAFADS
jgi:kynurenine formamidase